jgi:formylglycine-generating enzyme required for sulfatase activity
MKMIFFLLVGSIAVNAGLAKPAEEIAIELSEGITLEMVYIPPGEFDMGSPEAEKNRQLDEGPVRKVGISRGFFLGKYEITQAQWKAIMKENPSVFHGFEDSDRRPVERVTWEDCQLFVKRLNARGKGVFRLPTEAEWEYACRAGSAERFPWGVDLAYSGLFEHAWFFSRSEGTSHPVGSKEPNAWGLYDMHGNVWEWVADWYGPYPSEPQIDPLGPESGQKKVIRGGSWFNEPEALRSANRNAHHIQSRQTNTGLRVVLEATRRLRGSK